MKTSIAALSIAFALVLVAGALPAFADSPITITVVQFSTHQPVAGAQVISNTGTVLVTDANGQVQFPASSSVACPLTKFGQPINTAVGCSEANYLFAARAVSGSAGLVSNGVAIAGLLVTDQGSLVIYLF